ncbi:N-acetylgalactosamine kinase-like [Tachyglossus aculeatus]|uniref:N-acetylgalactosamine kinase-like n=1 Tax=Tachyglossus aculeatus TaxID=9261 RepID=UPI0018F473FF|nr:N-acetylgalactosamine kinase-like [Tachyglossus aculeatus]
MMAVAPDTRRVQVAEHPRLLNLKEKFISKFGATPKFYARAPGRVNLIGEHIDYCGYSVLPMAVEQDILIAVEPVQTQVLQLANTNPLYPDFSSSVNDIQINAAQPLWHNYFLCGLKGIQEHFSLRNLTGMNCLVDGNIPASSGLSSSSALVCCAGLVAITAYGLTLSKPRTNIHLFHSHKTNVPNSLQRLTQRAYMILFEHLEVFSYGMPENFCCFPSGKTGTKEAPQRFGCDSAR